MSCGVMLCVRRDERDAAQAAVIPEIVQLGDVAPDFVINYKNYIRKG